jgi:hypothetical protein
LDLKEISHSVVIQLSFSSHSVVIQLLFYKDLEILEIIGVFSYFTLMAIRDIDRDINRDLEPGTWNLKLEI